MARHLNMSNAEFETHDRTYHGFGHMLLWFVIHMALILLGLFALGIVGTPSGGVTLILIGIAALGYGIFSTPRAAARAAERDRRNAENPVVADEPETAHDRNK